MKLAKCLSALALGSALWAGTAQAEDGTFSQKSLTPEVAVQLAQATLEACRAEGYQIAVAVVDRGGNLQALIRDRFAGPHTPVTAERKAYTALSFKANTTDLAASTQPGMASSGTRGIPKVLMLGGGVMIESGGSLLGGIGVSGAPSGEADQGCAEVGLEAIEDVLGF
ncbi:heme-binding protein [Magnetovibrio sp. PR-2]|uniref:GlcG/HbpS family heme-binding protein n=1 Tax=Magnetovibrio sp. PR-2 TaxID=3120356 RepID=UPI002FCE2F51